LSDSGDTRHFRRVFLRREADGLGKISAATAQGSGRRLMHLARIQPDRPANELERANQVRPKPDGIPGTVRRVMLES
jgi:hypothetical protein